VRTLYHDLTYPVHDKNVRRRRAVLALLVVLSLILISASFGSSGTGPLHSVQSGFLDVVSPIESGANKALTPVHDLFKWIDDVVNASSQRDKLQKQVRSLRAEIASSQALWRENKDAAAMLGIISRDHLSADGPVSATITSEPQNLFVVTIQIDAGSSRGVQVGDPVFNADGLVGKVASVAADASSVTLIDDNSSTVAAIDNANDELGIIGADPGNPNLLQMTYVRDPTKLKVGDFVVTAGRARTDGAQPLFPPDIPIGTIASTPPPSDDTGTITVTPFVDFGALGAVTVLTKVAP
jgi:rod shape-determining protein MreC